LLKLIGSKQSFTDPVLDDLRNGRLILAGRKKVSHDLLDRADRQTARQAPVTARNPWPDPHPQVGPSQPHPGRNVELVDPRDQVTQAPNVRSAAMADNGITVADPLIPQPTLSELQPGRAYRGLVRILWHTS